MYNRILFSRGPSIFFSFSFFRTRGDYSGVAFFFPCPSSSFLDRLDCDVYMILARASLSAEIAPVGIRIL